MNKKDYELVTIMYDYMHEHCAMPSIPYLAEKLGITPSGISFKIKRLKEKGVLIVSNKDDRIYFSRPPEEMKEEYRRTLVLSDGEQADEPASEPASEPAVDTETTN